MWNLLMPEELTDAWFCFGIVVGMQVKAKHEPDE